MTSSGQRVAALAVAGRDAALGRRAAESHVRRQLVEERVLERVRERDALRRLVLEHAADKVKEQGVVLVVRHLVALERLAVLAHVPARRALVVPVEAAVVKVLGLRLAAHPLQESNQSKSIPCTAIRISNIIITYYIFRIFIY